MTEGNHQSRSGRDRRDWDLFVHPDRRKGQDRRSDSDRRQSSEGFDGFDRRRKPSVALQSPPPQPIPSDKESEKIYYTTAEVVDMTGLSQTTLLLWIRNKVIDGSRIKRSIEGKRLWTREDIEQIEQVKVRNGWTG